MRGQAGPLGPPAQGNDGVAEVGPSPPFSGKETRLGWLGGQLAISHFGVRLGEVVLVWAASDANVNISAGRGRAERRSGRRRGGGSVLSITIHWGEQPLHRWGPPSGAGPALPPAGPEISSSQCSKNCYCHY